MEPGARGSGRPGDRHPAAAAAAARGRSALRPQGRGGGATTGSGALVLFDTTGPWGFLGELYAIGAANLASHFGGWTAKPVAAYACGDVSLYAATLYLGSTYDEPLPACFLDDVLGTQKPVIWAFYNLWQLTDRAGGGDAFAARFGWTWTALDFSSVGEVDYKGHSLARYPGNLAGILDTAVSDPTKAAVLATAVRSDGSTFPWAVRGANLTYVGEIPFSYMNEEDRVLAFADLLFDALAPATPERHRALLRIEDISPDDDPTDLRAVADYLSSQGIPFGFGVIASYQDPLGFYNDGQPVSLVLRQSPQLVSALGYLASHGGTPVMHGYTHQWSGAINPYTEVTGDDFEFYRVTENADHSLTYGGPLPGDSTKWAQDRIDAASRLFQQVRLPVPAIFEFPHYAASVADYQAAVSRFGVRWERALYFGGALRGGAPDYTKMFGQLFPYAVTDVYGTKVLPENLGDIEPTPVYIFPMRLPADLVNAAEKNLVVRDGFASFYFHPFFDISLLQQTVDGIRALGYTFVSPQGL